MAFPTSPVDGQIYNNYKYNLASDIWCKREPRVFTYSGSFATVGNGQFIPEFESSVYANIGEMVIIDAVITGRPNVFGHTYFYVYIDGVNVSTAHFCTDAGTSNWIRSIPIKYSFMADSDKTYLIQLKTAIGSGAANYGNGDAGLHWEVRIE